MTLNLALTFNARPKLQNEGKLGGVPPKWKLYLIVSIVVECVS